MKIKLSAMQIIQLSAWGTALILFSVLAFAFHVNTAICLFCSLSLVLLTVFTARFFVHKGSYDVYFIAQQVLIGIGELFFVLGTFTTSLAFTFVALAGMLSACVFYACIRKGSEKPWESVVQDNWRKLARKVGKLTSEEARNILEKSLRYKLDNDKLDGELLFNAPLHTENEVPVTFSECKCEDGKAEIGAYIDRIINNGSNDENVEVL